VQSKEEKAVTYNMSDEFDGRVDDECHYDEHCNVDYESFEEWASRYLHRGLNKWGKGVCWDWCEHGICYEDFNCGMAHPILAIESTPGGKGCCIEIKSSRALIGLPKNDKSEGSRLPHIEGMIKRLGFVEQQTDIPQQQNQEPLVFEREAELKVWYAEKEDAKSLGALWNPDKKIWYVPAGMDIRPFEKWSPKVDGKFVASMAYDSVAYLNTTYLEKDEAKSLGAFWDPKERKWYVPPGKSLRPFLKWNPNVSGQQVGCRTRTPMFINEELDEASAIKSLRRNGMSNSMFEFSYRKRPREDMNAIRHSSAGNRGVEGKDDETGTTAALKRTRCSSPERDGKLPAAVTPQK